jgi:hypothetical protein
VLEVCHGGCEVIETGGEACAMHLAVSRSIFDVSWSEVRMRSSRSRCTSDRPRMLESVRTPQGIQS